MGRWMKCTASLACCAAACCAAACCNFEEETGDERKRRRRRKRRIIERLIERLIEQLIVNPSGCGRMNFLFTFLPFTAPAQRRRLKPYAWKTVVSFFPSKSQSRNGQLERTIDLVNILF